MPRFTKLLQMSNLLVSLICLGSVAMALEDAQQRNNSPSNPLPIGIHNHPIPMRFSRHLDALPVYDPKSEKNWQVDLRGMDLTAIPMARRLQDLMHADFDSQTKWPGTLPQGFDYQRIMELGKNPGLGVRALHKKGITGKGVGLAILDQNLLTEHTEYKDRLRHYEEIHWPEGSTRASMHGAAVASIAVGKTVGVAPEADLYYIAEWHGNFDPKNYVDDFTWLAKSIDRILEINGSLPEGGKIRVISISVGWPPNAKGYKEVMSAVKRARKDGIFIVSSSLKETFGLNLGGLGRMPLSDPDSAQCYEPGVFWQKYFFADPQHPSFQNELLVPMDSRCTASPTGANDYVYYCQGGLSWSIPYLAGLYALACQVKPDITPELFWRTALETGAVNRIQRDGKSIDLGRIAQPEQLMDKLAAMKKTK